MPRERRAGAENGTKSLDDVWTGDNGLAKAIDNIFLRDFDKNRKISKSSSFSDEVIQ